MSSPRSAEPPGDETPFGDLIQLGQLRALSMVESFI
jgi:hypothetical protein